LCKFAAYQDIAHAHIMKNKERTSLSE